MAQAHGSAHRAKPKDLQSKASCAHYTTFFGHFSVMKSQKAALSKKITLFSKKYCIFEKDML